MITVPEEFAEWRVRVDGEPARAWVRSLPVLVEQLVQRWELVVDDAEPMHGALSLVILVRRGEEPLALKVTWREETTEDEDRALRAWQGRGVVALRDSAPDVGALLLERLDHRRTLHTLPLWEAAAVAGSLIRVLAVAAPSGMRTLREVAEGMPDRLTRRQRALGDPVPARWVQAACDVARQRGSVGEQVLIHADLHYGNVLAGTRRPWLAVDPRALHGAPEYSVPELMWTRADDLRSDADVRRLLDVIVDAGSLDTDSARDWVVVRCVDYWLWGREHGLTIDPVHCERLLGALAPLHRT